MSRTITALFDTRSDAEAGRARLVDANVDADNVRILDQQTTGSTNMGTSTADAGMSSTSTTSNSYSTADQPGIWAAIKNAFLPDEDRATYEEGIRRGGFVLTADVDEDEVDRAVDALEDANSVDIDERSNAWRAEGWTAPAAAATAPRAAMFGSDTSNETDRISSNDGDVIPVIEEQLIVGKREVERGGVRVRSYVTEKPVHEQIRLREERVQVDRRPVDRALDDTNADAFRERTISVNATSEEAVVNKTAHVVEEVVVSKSVDERVEDINETVRRTDVDVDNLGTTTGSTGTGTGGASGGVGSTAAGLGNEAMGNIKQGLGSLTGNESLEQSGEAQERRGESQQGKTSGGY